MNALIIEDEKAALRNLKALLAETAPEITVVGELENVDFPAGQEMWVIRAPEKEGGYEILFPAVPEFVRDIDLTAETATIAPPEGLLDLYREGAAADLPDDGQEEEDAASSSKA